ncbi:RICIN domain-containing protein [Actinoplanes sp. NPDC089786]|uniref:protein kinase domain-containing protein n=1 Tax=Actinoplanes sp. NPDC089786 TaxID=3155185 RepID=UPI00343EBF96
MIEHVSAQHEPLQPDDPRHIGPYEVVGRLGAGGMGVVFLARTGSGLLVAVKLVHAELARDADFRSRFRGEVERARQVPPFCTAAVLDADPEAPLPYLVVEYVDGPSLTQEVQSKGPLTSANVHAVAIGVATALAAIHDAGVIHRDLKPSNVLLAPGSPKVIDFGIARAMEASAVQLTRTGQIFGSVNYMAPERFGAPGVPLTSASDIFAWGCVIAFARTGRAPFEADSPMATMARILTQPPMLDGIEDGPLRTLVEQALLTDPAQRPTARELLDRLLAGGSNPVLGPQPERGGTVPDTRVPARDPQSGSRRRRPTALMGAAALVMSLALAGGGAFLASRNSYANLTDSAATQNVGPFHQASSPAPPQASPTPTHDRAPAPRTERPPAATAPRGGKSSPKATGASPPGRRNQPPVKSAGSNGVAGYGPYFVHNYKTGMCVDLPGTGGGSAEQPVGQSPCRKTDDDNQEWTFVRHGADANGNQLYWINNVDDGLCLDVPGTGTVAPGTAVVENGCFGQDNQLFRLVPRLTSHGRQYYRLVNATSAMCLDVFGIGDGAAGAGLTLVGCVDGDDHEWALVEKSEW